MISSLSILIPTYNYACVALVKSLRKQALAIDRLDFEILVLDDGSTDNATIEANKGIDNLSHCRYLMRGYNKGRAATRNELARRAKDEWLLFVDSDRGVHNNDFIKKYLALTNAMVVYGGYILDKDTSKYKGNLRYKYEYSHRKYSIVSERNKHPYSEVCTTNFLVKRDIMLKYPLDERFVKYGYEDVMWGKTLCEAGIKILHIDNPVDFGDFENNHDFLERTTTGIATLVEFSEELRGYSKIIDVADKIREWHLANPMLIGFKMVKDKIKFNLTGNNPSVFLFNIYKVGLFLILSER